jgi:hypothetical protein
MDEDEDLQLTPALLNFYRTRVHELQGNSATRVLERVRKLELSSQERKALQLELLEYEDGLEKVYEDLDDMRNALVRERRAVIELVEENAQLRGTLETPVHFQGVI